MMDYGLARSTQQQNVACAGQPAVPHFEGLPSLAERAEMATDRIQRFIDRFHGCPSSAASAAQLSPVESGHLGQLKRLGRSIERLEQLASELDSIG